MSINTNFRESNPKLHLLYVGWAIRHLTMVDRMITQLYNESNSNPYDFAYALHEEMLKKIKDDQAYEDAYCILVEAGLLSIDTQLMELNKGRNLRTDLYVEDQER